MQEFTDSDSVSRRMLARRFPYAVYYRIIEGEAVVFRVLDCRRAPRRIRNSLKKMR